MTDKAKEHMKLMLEGFYRDHSVLTRKRRLSELSIIEQASLDGIESIIDGLQEELYGEKAAILMKNARLSELVRNLEKKNDPTA